MPTATPQPSPLRWLFLDLNSYFASVEQQLDPALRGRPVAVVPTATDSTCAIAASYEAKAFGVKTGTRIWEAKKMCPGLVCIVGQHEKYVEYHHRVIEEVERHIPITSVESIDEVACQLMSNEAAPEVATALAYRIKSGIRKNVGEVIRCSIGIAPNKYLAKVATNLQKPDGLVLLKPGEISRRLLACKPSDLPGIGRMMESRLHQAGVTTMAQLLALSPKHMRAIWRSVEGERLWYNLRGHEIPREETRRSSVGHSHVLAPELRAPREAREVARRLTVKAASRLRRMEYVANAMHFSARLASGSRWSAEARCYHVQDNDTFLRMLDELWQQMLLTTKTAPLKKVSVTLHALMPASEIQPELFDNLQPAPRKRTRSESLSRAMDKLNQRYGRNTVSIGTPPNKANAFTGTKVAFTRIPQMQEFRE